MFPGWTQFPEGQIVGFVLILFRMLAFVFAMPVFGTGPIPVNIKILLSIVLSVVLYPLVIVHAGSPMAISEEVVLWVLREIAIGLFLGFLMRFFFFAISIAGELIGVSSGLAAAQMFNPAMGVNSNIIEQFHALLATLFFLALDGHHFFLSGMAQSFDLLPIGIFGLNIKAFGSVGTLLTDVMIFGVKMAAPILVSIFLAQLGLGIIGRAVPQINVFVTSLQVTVILTFLILILTVPANNVLMNEIAADMAGKFMRIMRAL